MIFDLLEKEEGIQSNAPAHFHPEDLIGDLPMQNFIKTPLPCEPVLLLTGCIDPRGMRDTVRNNPDIRRQDYLKAFRRWVTESHFQKIVFCENSGADLSDFEEIARGSGKEIDLLSFTAPNYPVKRGKSYGEMLILEHAIENSSLIGADTRIMKCTGRLFILSHRKYYQHGKEQEFDFSVDMNRGLSECEVRVFFASADFLRRFLFPFRGRLDETVSPQICLEQVVGQAANRALSELMVYSPLPCAQLYVGHSGSLGHKYSPWQSMIGRAMKIVPASRMQGGFMYKLNSLRIKFRK